MTQSHIKFEPLILPRKTPAEEARQLRDAWANADINASNAVDCLVELIDRLETPDAPKRWDGVFPWVRASLGDDNVPIVYFDKNLCLSGATGGVVASPLSIVSDDRPYHDGVIITITAGSGDEFPRVVGLNSTSKDLRNDLWLRLNSEYAVKLRRHNDWCDDVGHVEQPWFSGKDRDKPLPLNTITRITINNTLPTTEQRYSVEVVESKEPEKPKEWRVSDRHRLVYIPGDGVDVLDNTRRLLLGIDKEDIESWCDGLNSVRAHIGPQEQPATEAVTEGLPLEVDDMYDGSKFEIEEGSIGRGVLMLSISRRDTVQCIHLDLPRIDRVISALTAHRDSVLNQRHADGKGGVS